MPVSTTHRRCTHPEHEGKRYLPVSQFHKAGRYKGIQKYVSHCKTCRNRDHRERYADEDPTRTAQWEHKKAYLRARSRAFTKLTYLVPELWEQVLVTECAKEGLDLEGTRLKTRGLYNA